jgi:hypothetical protein
MVTTRSQVFDSNVNDGGSSGRTEQKFLIGTAISGKDQIIVCCMLFVTSFDASFP